VARSLLARAPAPVLALVLVIAVPVGLLTGCAGPGRTGPTVGNGGDPGGATMAVLRTLRDGLPSGARLVHVMALEPRWIAGCGTGYSADVLHKGWSQLTYAVWFASSDPVDRVEAEVTGRLAPRGWRSGPLEWYGNPSTTFGATPSNGTLMDNYIVDLAHGPVRVAPGTSEARLTGATPVSGYVVGQPVLWVISAAATPHGPVGSCGAP
jgi:hypothetical protein